MIYSIWSTLKTLHFVYMISKIKCFLKQMFWCVSVGVHLKKVLWLRNHLSELKSSAELKSWKVLYWTLLYFCETKQTAGICSINNFSVPSFRKETHSTFIFLIINKRFMSLIDRLLKQCLCRKTESVGSEINSNLNLTDYKEMEAEWGPSVITVSSTLEPRIPVIFLTKGKCFWLNT